MSCETEVLLKLAALGSDRSLTLSGLESEIGDYPRPEIKEALRQACVRGWVAARQESQKGSFVDRYSITAAGRDELFFRVTEERPKKEGGP